MKNLPNELYTAAQVREMDRLTIEEFGVPGYDLMCRAGEAAFRAASNRWPSLRRAAVVCGVGNNGGDGFVFARLARKAGFEVRVAVVGDKDRLHGAAATAAGEMEAMGVTAQRFEPEILAGADLIVDALFGTGLDREVVGDWRDAIDAVNQSGAKVLAMDIPSGLHADTGRGLGAVVRADATISFIGLKRGLYTGVGPDYCGTVVYDDLGVPPQVFARLPAAARRLADTKNSRLLVPRPRASHKGNNGRVLVVGGDNGMGGAVRMAAEAAARVGAGLVTVATRERHIAAINTACPELICYGVEDAHYLDPLLKKVDAVAIGPGLGTGGWGRDMLERVFFVGLPLVVDADALNLLAGAPQRRGNWILTPHPGEASRLLNWSTADIQNDRFAAVTELQRRFGGSVVLKGAGTLVADDSGVVCLCDAGNPGMASGGMGDILTGVLAGLTAQATKAGINLAEVAQVGVCVHAEAGDMAARDGERGTLATDLLPHLRHLVNPQSGATSGF